MRKNRVCRLHLGNDAGTHENLIYIGNGVRDDAVHTKNQNAHDERRNKCSRNRYYIKQSK